MRVAVAAGLLFLASTLGSCSYPLKVVFFNNTPVDLHIWRAPGKTFVVVAPGKSIEVVFSDPQWIDFGQIAHKYQSKDLWEARDLAYGPDNARRINMQVESNGRIYVVPRDAHFPVNPLPEQPRGFPMEPAEKVDLTEAPPNNCVQPTQNASAVFRG